MALSMKQIRLNKKIIKITSLKEYDEKEYWLSKSPAERLKAIEINRKLVYGYGDTAPRFQRFFEIKILLIKNPPVSLI